MPSFEPNLPYWPPGQLRAAMESYGEYPYDRGLLIVVLWAVLKRISRRSPHKADELISEIYRMAADERLGAWDAETYALVQGFEAHTDPDRLLPLLELPISELEKWAQWVLRLRLAVRIIGIAAGGRTVKDQEQP